VCDATAVAVPVAVLAPGTSSTKPVNAKVFLRKM